MEHVTQPEWKIFPSLFALRTVGLTLSMTTNEKGDAKTLTNKLIAELEKTGLSTYKMLRHDGASLMCRANGVQKILLDKLGRLIPNMHCFNHQHHLVVFHAISTIVLRDSLNSSRQGFFKY